MYEFVNVVIYRSILIFMELIDVLDLHYNFKNTFFWVTSSLTLKLFWNMLRIFFFEYDFIDGVWVLTDATTNNSAMVLQNLGIVIPFVFSEKSDVIMTPIIM